jgi:Zn-dependent M28 family amino/carboxypeptidase
MPGKDAAYADQVIIVSANYDGVGKSPDGTVWLGANGNASGVAVLLEIARSWQEQAYVPSVTVLFAAWDAHEQESLGAEYYIQNPKYPLDKTIAVIQLEGVGAGGEILHVDGLRLAERIEAAAQSFGVETTVTDELTGDHRLFAEAGVPAHALTWVGAGNFSHLPTDSPDNIRAERLEQAGQIADLMILSLSEGSPAINDLLARRCSAIIQGDLNSFLNTSTLRQKQNDEVWFADVGQLKPIGCEMIPANLTVAGNTARADVDVRFDIPTDGETEMLNIDMQIMFQHDSDGWKWDGSNLVTMESISEGQTSFTVHHPADSDDEEIDGLGQHAVEEYIQIADLLSLSSDINTHIYIFSDRAELWGATAPSRKNQLDEWAGPDVLKLAFNPIDHDSARLQSSLTKLLLANAGIPDTSFAWLWEGLPLVVNGNEDQVELQSRMLSPLQTKLSNGDFEPSPETSWAAVDYLRQRVGWAGLGNFITSLGRACQRFDCEAQAGADQALSTVLRMDQDSFDTAWQAHWRTQLDSAQAVLDAVLAKRTEAVLSGNEALFLETVDRNTANLLDEERDWFADLSRFPPDSFLLTGKPLALLDNGDILASVRMEYELEGVSAVWGKGSLPMNILFILRNGEYHWAGPLTESVFGNRIRVRYPVGQEELAKALLADAETLYAELADDMDVSDRQLLTIILYDDRIMYRTSVSLSFPAPEWMPGWSAPGHSIKLLLADGENAEDYNAALVAHLSRQLLIQKGVRDEWLLAGAGSYLSRNVAGGVSQKNAASSLASLARAVKNEAEFDLADFPSLYHLSQDDYRVALPQAWDTIRYLAETYGEDDLMALLASQRNVLDMDTALRSATRLSMPEFASAWKESFVLGHFPPTSLETSQAYDVEGALEHIDFLTSPGLAGRQAGSPGSSLAAEYIAQQFADSGLIVEQQYFPVTYQTHLATPVMKLVLNNETVPFVYREDFLVLQHVDTNGTLSGELIWIADENYTGMELDGKIAVRKPSLSIQEEIDNALEHGASSLLLVGDRNQKHELFSKFPFASNTPEDAIPVYELTRRGYSRLLELTGQTQAGVFNTYPAILFNTKIEVELSLSESEMTESSNVMGLLEGKNPELKDEVIIVGAHYDHVGDDVDMPYRGANDNASGVAVLLEIARLWHETGYRPERSVLFVAWGAQELGEVGSQYYAAIPIHPLENTVAMLQLDAVGGGKGYYLEASGDRGEEGALLYGIEKASELLGTRLQTTVPDTLASSEAGWLFSPGYLFSSSRIVANSDDVVFREAGIPSLLLRWQKTSEDNLPDSFADEVLPERLEASGKTIMLTLMMLAR